MIYVISDIHGDYPSFYKMLLKINFSSSDSLCILGDVVDKGSDNLYLLEFIRHMENVPAEAARPAARRTAFRKRRKGNYWHI